MEFGVHFDSHQGEYEFFIEINAGSGGKESEDFSSILQRMYVKYLLSLSKTSFEIITEQVSSYGLKYSLIKVVTKQKLDLSYESGVHRLTRVSPFGNGKLHTSFANVNILFLDKSSVSLIENISKNEVDMSFYRGSGAGGQHRNKVETGVRLKHKKTGIVVEVCSERSQHQNKENAFKLLAIKINNKLALEKKQQNNTNYNNRTDISFGQQVRTYKLDKNIIKNEINNFSTQKIKEVLNGNINIFYN